MKLLERVRQFQEFALEVGLARGFLALPSPKTLSLPAPSSDEASGSVTVFTRTIVEAEIESVCRDLFASGYYSHAVQEAYKAVEKAVQKLASEQGKSGTSLMDYVFSPEKPKLEWTDRKTTSETDEQRGYQRLFSGAMLGIRNPVIHEFEWVDDGRTALELIIFAQHLLKKAKAARPVAAR